MKKPYIKSMFAFVNFLLLVKKNKEKNTFGIV